MTGRDFITYILTNNLENEPLCDGKRLLGFLTAEEAAAKFEVGLSTVQTWIDLGMIDAVQLEPNCYIPANVEHPMANGGNHA